MYDMGKIYGSLTYINTEPKLFLYYVKLLSVHNTKHMVISAHPILRAKNMHQYHLDYFFDINNNLINSLLAIYYIISYQVTTFKSYT